MEEENHVTESEDDYDIFEFYLDDADIGELIEKLQELLESKRHVHFNVDDENSLVMHHVDEEESNEDTKEEE